VFEPNPAGVTKVSKSHVLDPRAFVAKRSSSLFTRLNSSEIHKHEINQLLLSDTPTSSSHTCRPVR